MSSLPVISPVLWACLSLAAPVIFPAVAQDTPPPAPVIVPNVPSPAAGSEPEVALDELIRRALSSSPQLSIARENLEAARLRVNTARASASPTLQVVAGLGKREAREEEIILSQPIDIFGKRRARAGVFTAEARRAEAQNVLAERSLVVEVKNAVANLFAAQEAETLGGVQVEVAQLFRDAAARRAELGDVPPVQVQRAELELLRVQNELNSAQVERLTRRAQLNQLVGQAPETPLRVALPIANELSDVLRLRSLPVQPSMTPGVLPSAGSTTSSPLAGELPSSVVGASSQIGSELVSRRAQLLTTALTRPDIASAEATLEARRAQVRVLERERRPDIELQLRRDALTGSGSTALRAVVVVPLFDFGANKNERRALEAEARADEAAIALLRSQAAMQVEQALLRLQQQRQTIERYRTGIVPLTLDLLRKTQIGYSAGASTYLEVLEAQRTLKQVQTEYLQALVGTRTTEAALESALGATPSAELFSDVVNPSGPETLPGVAEPGTVSPIVEAEER